MARQLRVPLTAICLAGLWGCAGVSSSDPPETTVERNRGNATVRAAVYVEAARNVAAPIPVVPSETAAAAKSAATRGKQDKRQPQASKKDNKRTATAVPPLKQVTAAAASETAGRSIDPRVPVSATGYRYTYSVELDGGGTKTFGFATDQGLLVGDRVMVSDTGVTMIPKPPSPQKDSGP